MSSDPEWVCYDYRHRAGIIRAAEGQQVDRDRTIGLFKLLDPECQSIVVLSGAWLIGGYYLTPHGWVSLTPPRYHLP